MFISVCSNPGVEMPILQVEFHHGTGRGKDIFTEFKSRHHDDNLLLKAGVTDRVSTITVLRMEIGDDALNFFNSLKIVNQEKRKEMGQAVIDHDRLQRLIALYNSSLTCVRQYVSLRLDRLLRSEDKILVRKYDRTFRSVRREEVLDIQAGIKTDCGVWMFVYQGDDLINTDHNMILSIML